MVDSKPYLILNVNGIDDSRMDVLFPK